MAETDLIMTVITAIGALFGIGLSVPILTQFVNNVSRNMSQTNANVTEEISKVSTDKK